MDEINDCRGTLPDYRQVHYFRNKNRIPGMEVNSLRNGNPLRFRFAEPTRNKDRL